MPFRNPYIRSLDPCVEFVAPQPSSNVESDASDKAFNAEMETDVWADWMRWEGGTAELDSRVMPMHECIASSSSSPEVWTADIETTPRGAMSSSLTLSNGYLLEGALFELDKPAQVSEAPPLASKTSYLSKVHVPSQFLQSSIDGYSPLTPAEKRNLQDVAVPYQVLSKATTSSPSPSPIASHASLIPTSKPEGRPHRNKKRKSMDLDVPTGTCQSRKKGHNAIEKRYRTNLNEKINCLRQGVPSIRRLSPSEPSPSDEVEDPDGDAMDPKSGQQKYGKAAILTRALEYIQHLETTAERLGGEVAVLQSKVETLGQLAATGFLRNRHGAPNAPPVVRTETLQSIQYGMVWLLSTWSRIHTDKFPLQISNRSSGTAR